MLGTNTATHWAGRAPLPTTPTGARPSQPYLLPELGYDYGALEPHISGRIMELHHRRHHAGHVKSLNLALTQLDAARANRSFLRLAALERTLAFNLSGHVMHSLFWRNLSPQGGGMPGGALAAAIDRDLGSFGAFQRQFNATGASVTGSGWAALVWEPLGRRLLVIQIYDHQSNLVQGSVPLMVADAWEHAYYLQYHDRRADFFAALWRLWDWTDICARFEAAQRPRSISPEVED
ncbi:MAG: superoxide dismutase [Deltaproteobacteria bacterium]|nr:superoxide dismutase [Deltaproteobacteria bacterium]